MTKRSFSFSQRIDRYLAIVAWLRARYTVSDQIIISVGGMPSAYSRIEQAAAKKYLLVVGAW